MRASVVRPSVHSSVKTVFSEPIKHNAKFGGKVPLCRYLQTSLFSKILHFWFFFLQFCFVFFNMGPDGRKKRQTTPSLKLHDRFTPKNLCILLRMVYQSCIKIGKISNLGFLPFFVSFSLTWAHRPSRVSRPLGLLLLPLHYSHTVNLLSDICISLF